MACSNGKESPVQQAGTGAPESPAGQGIGGGTGGTTPVTPPATVATDCRICRRAHVGGGLHCVLQELDECIARIAGRAGVSLEIVTDAVVAVASFFPEPLSEIGLTKWKQALKCARKWDDVEDDSGDPSREELLAWASIRSPAR